MLTYMQLWPTFVADSDRSAIQQLILQSPRFSTFMLSVPDCAYLNDSWQVLQPSIPPIVQTGNAGASTTLRKSTKNTVKQVYSTATSNSDLVSLPAAVRIIPLESLGTSGSNYHTI